MSADPILYPCNFVIFGATGNLASNKLLPALYNLEAAGRLPDSLNFVAFSRREWNDEVWHQHVEKLLQEKLKEQFNAEIFKKFIARFCYMQGELHDENAYQKLLTELNLQRKSYHLHQ